MFNKQSSLSSFRATAVALVPMAVVLAACGGRLDAIPDPPLVSAPSAGDEVRSPLTVAGTGLPGASLSILLTEEGDELASATGTVEESGEFSFDIEFSDRPLGALLELRLTQSSSAGESEPTVVALLQGSLGNRYESPTLAPIFQGSVYSNMQIYEVDSGLYMDLTAFLESLDSVQVIYFGEQHETAAIHELQLFVLQLLTERHDDMALAMEHFQSQHQGVIDDYLAGTISANHLRAQGDAWNNFEIYWQPLVDHMKYAGRPVIATNVPRDALQAIYANGLSSPLAFFNTWDETSSWDPYLPPRPLPDWDELFQAYFETGFDYSNHGQHWGLTYEEALDYFTDLAFIRDHTMGYWIAAHFEASGDRVFFVGGDWHVRTGIATPDLATYWGSEITRDALITTSRRAGFDLLRSAEFEGRPYADFILVYD